MAATLQELDQALELAIQEGDTALVEELATLVEAAETKETTSAGYQPTDYNLASEASTGLTDIAEEISGLPEAAATQLAKTQALGGSPTQAVVPILGKRGEN